MSPGEVILKSHIAEAFRQIKRQEPPEIHATFYPFAGLNHTIRIRKQHIYVRVSDIMRDAPSAVQRALAFILVSKLFNQQVKHEHQNLYQQYAYHPQVQRANDLARQQRGRKQITSPAGHAYNLDKLFTKLNRRYFDNALPRPLLSWSPRRSKRILGHHDSVHDAIVISRSLDDEEVPDYVVEFVLYHEMLHLKHPPRMQNGRRIYHSAAFRADERRFEFYEEAAEALAQMTSKK